MATKKNSGALLERSGKGSKLERSGKDNNSSKIQTSKAAVKSSEILSSSPKNPPLNASLKTKANPPPSKTTPPKIKQAFPVTAPIAPIVSTHQKGPKTRVVIKYDVGFNNLVTIRGNGAGLSWEKGAVLKNTKPDEWVFETEIPFTVGEFKVLINDTEYEAGENHTLRCGASIQYTPQF